MASDDSSSSLWPDGFSSSKSVIKRVFLTSDASITKLALWSSRIHEKIMFRRSLWAMMSTLSHLQSGFEAFMAWKMTANGWLGCFCKNGTFLHCPGT